MCPSNSQATCKWLLIKSELQGFPKIKTLKQKQLEQTCCIMGSNEKSSLEWNHYKKESYWQLCAVDLVRDERQRKLATKPLAPAPTLMRGWPVQRRTVTWDDRETSNNLRTWLFACGAAQKNHISPRPRLQLHSNPSLASWLTAQHWQSGS